MPINLKLLKIFQNKLAKSGLLNFTLDLPPNAEVYLVGGLIRDILINRKNPGDLDFVVRNVDINTLEKTLEKFGQVDFVGKHFGVFKFTPNHDYVIASKAKQSRNKTQKLIYPSSVPCPPSSKPIDIALPRTEHSFGTGAYKDFKVTYNPALPLKKDLSRRDFTINAIAWKISIEQSSNRIIEQSLIDPFHGLRDLQNKTIRTVGNPTRRFREDYSRLLRALRIACELNFKIQTKTLAAVKKLITHINDSNPRSESPEGRRAKTLSEESLELTERDDESKGPAPSKSNRLIPYEIIAAEILKSFQANPVRALDLLDETGALRELIPELLLLKNCPQPKKFHSEGDVWAHTRLALSLINSSKYRQEFLIKKVNSPKKKLTPSPVSRLPSSESLELILAVLFHDIGKPLVIKMQKNKISFRHHDQVSAAIAKKICKRLKLQAVPDFKISCQNISHLVAKHMLHLYNRISKLKNSTVVKYFLLDSSLGNKLQKLFWLDSLASLPQNNKPDLSGLKELKKRIAKLKKELKKTQGTPLLTGYDVMKEFSLKPGPKVGQLLSILHEAQLSGLVKTKKSALSFLKRELK